MVLSPVCGAVYLKNILNEILRYLVWVLLRIVFMDGFIAQEIRAEAGYLMAKGDCSI